MEAPSRWFLYLFDMSLSFLNYIHTLRHMLQVYLILSYPSHPPIQVLTLNVKCFSTTTIYMSSLFFLNYDILHQPAHKCGCPSHPVRAPIPILGCSPMWTSSSPCLNYDTLCGHPSYLVRLQHCRPGCLSMQTNSSPHSDSDTSHWIIILHK